MKLKLAAALVAGTAAMAVLAGCPVGTPNVTPSVEPFKFDTTSNLTGKVTYDGGKVEYADESYTQKVGIKPAGGASTGVTANIEEGMYFQFKNLTPGSAYQAIIDYKGAEPTKAEDINAIRLYVSAPATASATVDATTPMLNFDLEWVLNPTPAFDATVATFPMTFKFDGIQNFQGKYQILVSRENGSAFWSSAWNTGTTLEWNGRAGTETNSPTTGALITSETNKNFTYMIKFTDTNGTYGGPNVYGETQKIRFKVQ